MPYFCFNSTSHLFNRVRSENICTEINRKGTLCGECIDHHGPSIHTLKCIRCHADYMWALYLLSQYFPVTILFFLVLFLDIRITSAPANAFIFFAQVIPTVFTLDGGGAIHLTEASNKLVRVYTFLYNVWNLQFFQLEICLSTNLTTLNAIAITYLEAVYPLVLILVVLLFVRVYEKGYRHCWHLPAFSYATCTFSAVL